MLDLWHDRLLAGTSDLPFYFCDASRYWVGGTGTWNGTAGTKWATTSGGAGGAAVPTSANDVFMDPNSGASTVSVSGARACKTLTLTGFTGTLQDAGGASDAITVSGNINIAGKTVAVDIAMNASGSITSGGGTFAGASANSAASLLLSSGVAITLADALSVTGAFTLAIVGFDASDFNVTVSGDLTLTNTFSLSMGAGTWTIGGAFTASSVTTLSAETSTIVMTGTGGFAGDGETYNNVQFSASNTVTGANTFANLQIDAGVTVTFPAGETQTITSITWDGTPSSSPAVQSSSAGSAWNLSSSAALVARRASIKDCAASGGGTFVAINSTDVSGNSGWKFMSHGKGRIFAAA